MEPNSSNPPELPAAASTLLHRHFTTPPPSISQSNYHNYKCDYYYNQNYLQQSSSSFGLIPSVQRSRHVQDSKMARVCRRMARQRRLLCLNRNQPMMIRTVSAGSAVDVLNHHHHHHDDAIRRSDHDVYNFITPDNKRLRVLLKKALKNSDVGALGRIVLPKRAAEENLPSLVEKEGIQVVVREVSSDQSWWTFKYKFWSNNNSRMYVLENTGEFVRQKELGMGDSFTLYEDESKNLYVSITKGAESAAAIDRDGASAPIEAHNSSHRREEEEAEEEDLALLIDQVLASHDGAVTDHPTQNDGAIASPISRSGVHFTTFPENATCSWSTATVDTPVVGGQERRRRSSSAEDMPPITFDDCYGSLDMLPDVNHYNFSP